MFGTVSRHSASIHSEQVLYCIPAVLATEKAKAGKALEFRSSRPASAE